MKAVLLAGGLGTRMREETEFRPKPMVEVGGQPVLWHIMKHLSANGIRDFVICTGYKSEHIKNFFYNYGSSNLDFTIKLGDPDSVVFHGEHDEFDWNVTVVDTGPSTMTAGRLKRVRDYLGDDPFFCTYGDGIANVDIASLVEFHRRGEMQATMTVTQPSSRFGVVDLDPIGRVGTFREKPKLDSWVNIGFFIFESSLFDYIEGDSTVLEEEPLHALSSAGQLGAYQHSGFWQPMDTVREAQLLNEIWNSGDVPWKTWQS